MKIREIMTTEVATARPDRSLQEIAAMMRDEDVGAIPIVEDGELTGIVTDRDIVIRCIAEGRDPSEVTADEAITEGLETIGPNSDVREASRIMAERQIRRLPVVEEGALIGMVSIGDIAVKQADERITGEALEEVSAGVKASRAGRQKPAGKGKAAQGISNVSRAREEKRQARVMPFRKEAQAAGKASRRRKAS